ncbi:MAG: sensor histidine kinase [Methylophaga sp.]|nr:sensor histidine kinase [Methylophaga sp.]
MFRSTLSGLNKKTLQRGLVVFFIALVIPTAILIQQSYSRLKWEAFHQHQVMADELATRIDKQLLHLISTEEQRPFTDYSFLNVVGEEETRFFQRSPLSHYPVESSIPGIIGYFQVDSAGQLQTPLIPEAIEGASSYGISESEFAQRLALQRNIEEILSENHLVNKNVASSKEIRSKDKRKTNSKIMELDIASSLEGIFSDVESDESDVLIDSEAEDVIASVKGQAAFDELNKSVAKKKDQKSSLGRLEELELKQRYKEQKQRVDSKQEKRARMEQNALPESIALGDSKRDDDMAEVPAPSSASPIMPSELSSLRINTFESEVDPFEFSQLESGHFVLYRKVWLNEQRYIQGVLIESSAFLGNSINHAFIETALSKMSDLLVVHQGNVLEAFSAHSSTDYFSRTRALNGELLYQTRLSAPLSDMQLLFSITQLPAGPGGIIIFWLALIMTLVLCVGFYLMYRLGVGQINLANQQQDFVSAVSHELKTPLTSIRMYGEILREGWASEEKKKTYYDFIFDESERLSRLINNVLHLAKMTRNTQAVELKEVTVAELMDGVRSKVSSQIDRAGFELKMNCGDEVKLTVIKVDADWFNQIMINLVDNALKFSAKAEHKIIELSCHQLSKGDVQFTIRDYGPGVERQQMKKIFTLFYRTENELTRETVGTGIGLALVHQMTMSMNGQIDVVNKEPGAEFKVRFPVK